MVNVVWFKRDLRIVDNHALVQAAKVGPVLALYIFEPDLWAEDDMSYRHYIFLNESLLELEESLKSIGATLVIKVGKAVDVLQEFHEDYGAFAVWSHQETWNGWTYRRDKDVRAWCRLNNISWHESVQNGVVRGLKDRNGWSKLWYKEMNKPIVDKPDFIDSIQASSDKLPCYSELGLLKDDVIDLQKGGRLAGLKLLDSFFMDRGKLYTKEMSSPITAVNSCSRLSCYLAFGTLSLREVFQAAQQRVQEIKKLPKEKQSGWLQSMRSFLGRLRWHCHFIQKLEDQPNIEFENIHPLYDSIRNEDFNQAYFEAWKKGMTGYPMIDACMRSLIANGWLNFRMRAMLVSFASYHLWLHWRLPALHLARLFTDYEPGIHYSQIQMQSGTTGINAIRIYNPIKQGFDHDPEGVFIRKWVPELRGVDRAFLHTPWLIEDLDDYPKPIVNEKISRETAAAKLYGLRKNNLLHKEIAKKIVRKHASRKASKVGLKKKSQPNGFQGELPL